MHELVVPDLFTGRCFETDQTVAIKTVAGAMAAIIVVGRRADRQIDVAEFLVGAHRRPDIGGAGFLPGFLFPGLDSWLALLRNGVEGPEQPAGDDIEATNVAGRRRPLFPPVKDRRANHDDTAP